ncbi:hypothetical protein [Sphingomonas bacterium]|uniref:hypothetical protein n=1 Tax=Sphingomonas bacterium TaxID=1895847 RepID=UPI001576F0DC|nr:hypothetical protein [Sphingomonas bacterium]
MAQVATAASARDLLTRASFYEDSRDTALARVTEAQAAAGVALRRSPGDMEALLMQAMALGYRAKLTGNRADAVGARKQFELLTARDPRDADVLMALGAWHVGGVNRLGGLVGRTVLGAQKKVGFDALDRSVALGGNHALYSGIAALLRLEMDPSDPRGRSLAEAATRASTLTVLDRLMQRSATAVLASLRAGNADATKALASRLLPFGRLD